MIADTPPTAAPVIAYAHRGVHVATPAGPAPEENTAASIAAAATLGYLWVETDVRATSDGAVVLAHDPDLARVTGLQAIDTVVADHTLARLTALAAAAGYHLTTLEQASDAVPGVRLNVDVKADAAVPGVVALAERRPELVERWRVASFSERRRSAVVDGLRAIPGCEAVRSSASAPLSLAAVVIAHAPVPRALRGRAMGGLARYAGIDALQLPPTTTVPLPRTLVSALGPYGRWLQRVLTDVPVISAPLLGASHRGGLAVHGWTVDDPAQMRELAAAGVDAIITDEPEVLAGVLRERGQAWPQLGADRREAS